jgi:medium-chain acyl-CoA synthetase
MTVKSSAAITEDAMSDPSTAYNFTIDVVDALAAQRPDDLAMLWVDGDRPPQAISFEALSRSAARSASVLKQAGVKKGDTVLILLSREREWWEIILACLRIGAIASPGTAQLSAKDIAYRVEAATARCIVSTSGTAAKVDEASLPADMKLIHVGGPRPGWVDYAAEFTAAKPLTTAEVTWAGEDALCYFTSGTTGYPKMTIHTHGYTAAHRITGDYWLDLKPGDLHWNLSDTGWAKAAWSSLFGPWQRGAAIFVHHSSEFDVEAVLTLLEQNAVSTLCAPPTAYRMFVRHGLEGRRFARLRHCVSAGEPLNPEVIDMWRSATGLEIYDGYGQTETVLLCGNRPGARRQGSMGKPAPEFRMAVIDETGFPLPPRREGDIALSIAGGRPPGLFKEYRGDPDRTASVFRGDWYLTGDRGLVDEDGFFWFVGRSDDVILSSGYRIGPFEVESALFEHPAVAESAVVASPDPTRGEVVKAFVILSAGYTPSQQLVEELQAHVKATTAPYKYPRKIDFVASLPKTISGKIRRKELRDAEWAS